MTQTQNNLLFTIVVAFLILMALLLAAVGGLGLTTTMSINMMERVREVGVLRAIGASNASVRQIVLAEGIAMAVISWIVGALISLGLAPLFSGQLGPGPDQDPAPVPLLVRGCDRLVLHLAGDCGRGEPCAGPQCSAPDRAGSIGI